MGYKSVSVTIESYQRLQELKARIVATEPSKLPDSLRNLIAEGTSSCSVVGAALELLEERLDEIGVAVPRRLKKKTGPSSPEGNDE